MSYSIYFAPLWTVNFEQTFINHTCCYGIVFCLQKTNA